MERREKKEERRAHQTQLREVLRQYLEREGSASQLGASDAQLNLRYQALVAYRASMAASASQDHPNSANQRVDLSFASSFLRNLAERQVERGLENISNQIEKVLIGEKIEL